MVENKNYFMEKWKEYLKSDNLLQRYKAKQFIEILKDAKKLEYFDLDMFFRIPNERTVFDGEKNNSEFA